MRAKKFLVIGFVLMGMFTTSGCGRHEKTPGQALDEAIRKTGKEIQDTTR